MADIGRTNKKGLKIPQHYDPSVRGLVDNMEQIDDELFKALPEGVSFTSVSLNDAIFDKTGRYIVEKPSNGCPIHSSITSTSGATGLSPVYNYYSTAYRYILDVIDNGTNVTQFLTITGSTNQQMFFRYRPKTSTWTSSSSYYWVKMYNGRSMGSGTGLDADKLDSYQASQFAKLQNTSSFNSAVTPGMYYVTTATNAPDTTKSYWGCIVTPIYSSYSTTSYVKQLAFPYNVDIRGRIYERENIAGTWTAWCEIYTSRYHKESAYDYVINSQADFDNMLLSENWFGAKSIEFKCNVTTSKRDIVIPDTVRIIEGNSCRITGTTTRSFGYATLPSASYKTQLRIANLQIRFDNSYVSTGWCNCRNLVNCFVMYGFDSTGGKGFVNCDNLIDCKASLSGGSGSGGSSLHFYMCANLVNCFDNNYGGTSFDSCNGLYGCTAKCSDINAGHYLFRHCNDLHSCHNEPADGAVCCKNVFTECEVLYDCYIDTSIHDNSTYATYGFNSCGYLFNCYTKKTKQYLTETYKDCSVLIGCSGTTVDCANVFDWFNIWHRGNDGVGSGLDADLLDGKHLSEILDDSSILKKVTLPDNTDIETYVETLIGSDQSHSSYLITDSEGDSHIAMVATGSLEGSQQNALIISKNGIKYKSSMFDMFNFGSNYDTGWRNLWDSLIPDIGTADEPVVLYDLNDGIHWVTGTVKFTPSFDRTTYGCGALIYVTTQPDETAKRFFVVASGVAYTYTVSSRTASFATTIKFAFDTSFKNQMLANDGVGSSLDADLLDGVQGNKYARTDTSYITSLPLVSGVFLYKGTDITGVSGYFGITSSYCSSSYYSYIAVSCSDGKVYRKTNGATAWDEVTPKIPVLTSDPASPSVGQMWIRSDLA